MRKIFIVISSALLLVGCAKEINSPEGANGNVQTVTFTASIPSETTKAVSDEDGEGASVNRCIMEIYYGGSLFKRDVQPVTHGATITASFTAQVVANRTYTVAFWADCVESASALGTDLYYNTSTADGLQAISLKGTYAGNDDKRDAFFAVRDDCTVAQGGTSFDVTLKRPFAQINVITTDWDKNSITSIRPEKVDVTIKSPLSRFNALTGEAAVDTNVTSLNYNAAIYTSPASGTDATLSMDYIFASTDKAVIDIDWKAQKTGSTEIVHSFSNIPYQRNYRTNIKGNLLTSSAQWNVTVDPIWEAPEIEFKPASTLAQAQEIIQTDSENAIVVEVKQEAVTNATTDDVVTVGGKKYLQFILKTTSPLTVGFELPEITNTDYERLGADTWLVTYEPTYPTTDVTVDAPENTKVKIEAPTSHVEVTGTSYAEITASTGDNTLVVPSGISIDNLTVNKGGLEIHGTVAAASVDTTGGNGPVYVRDCEGLIKTVYDNLEPYIDVDNGYVGEKVAENNYRIYQKAESEKVAQIGDVKYYTLNAAFAAVNDGDTITLIKDCETGASYSETNMLALTAANVTLDLNGKTITETNNFSFVIAGNNDVVKNGIIVSGYNSAKTCLYHSYAMVVGAKTTSEKVTGVQIKNVTFTGGVSIGGSTEGNEADYQGPAEVTIDGCTITSGDFYAICAQPANSTSKATVLSGTYNHQSSQYSALFYAAAGCTISLKGGTYDADPSAYVAEGYEAEKDGDVWNVVTLKVAKIGSTKYETLAAAFEAVKDGETIELLHNCSLTATTTIDKNVTLNLGTCTLTNACSGYTFNLNTTESGKTFKITGTDADNFGHIVSNGTSEHKGLVGINGSAITFEMDYVKVHGANEDDAYVGTANANKEALINDYTSASDIIKLNDCRIFTTSVILGGTQDHSAAASLNISGGSYTGAKGFRYAGTEKSVIDGATITVDQGIALYPYSDTDLKDSFVYDNATGNLGHDAISVGGEGSDLVITNTTVESVSKTAVATENLGKATIEGGTFSSTCASNYGAPLRCNTSGGTIVVNGGTIDGSHALYAVFSNTKLSQYPNAVSTITINGGTVKGGSSDMGFVSGGKAYVEINGGTFTTAVKLFEGNQQWIRINSDCTATFNEKVTGMNGTASVAIPAGTFKKAVENGDFTAGASISGGLFYEAAPYSSYIAAGRMAVQNEGTPETWSIKNLPGVGLGSMGKDNQDW